MPDLQLWGGCEYTLNRVGGHFHDQTVRSGHHERASDLQLFADLGLQALRYPVLWERVSPHRPDERDFAWSDERLAEMRRIGLRPIVALCITAVARPIPALSPMILPQGLRRMPARLPSAIPGSRTGLRSTNP